MRLTSPSAYMKWQRPKSLLSILWCHTNIDPPFPIDISPNKDKANKRQHPAVVEISQSSPSWTQFVSKFACHQSISMQVGPWSYVDVFTRIKIGSNKKINGARGGGFTNLMGLYMASSIYLKQVENWEFVGVVFLWNGKQGTRWMHKLLGFVTSMLFTL